MGLDYKIDNQLLNVSIDGPSDGTCAVKLIPKQDDQNEGTTLEAKLVPIKPPRYLFIVNGKQYVTYAALDQNAWHINIDGHNYSIIPPSKLMDTKRGQSSIDAEKLVTPPMPGQVIKLLVEKGEEVKSEQPLVVISAMKMETTITAPNDGKVTAINTKVGAQVSPGDQLITIE